jgi:hypothetical protein
MGGLMKWLSKLFGFKAEPAPDAKPLATMKKLSPDTYELRIGGILNKATVDNIQAIGAREIDKGLESIKMLIILDGFLGWKKGDDWGDLSFFAEYGDKITKIAVIGEARWEAELLMFLGAGRRKGEVRFHTPEREAAARAWVLK